MNILKITAEEDMAVFKALCPQELMDIMESPDLSPTEYKKIMNTLKALGFYGYANLFTETRMADVKSRWVKSHPEDVFLISSSRMQEEKYGYEYVDMFINNIKNENLKIHFKTTSENYTES